MRWTILPVTLLAAGCAAGVAPGVSPSSAPAGAIVACSSAPSAAAAHAGPLVVTTSLPSPAALASAPPATPTPDLFAPSCRPEGSCAPAMLKGSVYDAAGHLITAPLDVLLSMKGSTDGPRRVGGAVQGQYEVALPRSGDWVVRVQGAGHGARERPLGPLAPTGGASELDFGGPAGANDPDAAAFYLPGDGMTAGYVQPGPGLPFETSTVTTVAGDGGQATMDGPEGPSVGPGGLVAFAEVQSNRISTWIEHGQLSLLAGGPHREAYQAEQNLLDGQGAAAHFNGPTDVAYAPDGALYVADSGNCAIRRVTPDGTVSTLAGNDLNGQAAFGYVDGHGHQARFYQPMGLAVDHAGNLFVADSENHCVRKVTPQGDVTTFAGANEAGYANGPAAQARFRRPTKLAIDAQDDLYVADGENGRIRKVTPAGVVSDFYGAPTNRQDGTAVLSPLAGYGALAAAPNGDLYATAGDGTRIFRITPAGVVTILAGYGLYGYKDGGASEAYFSSISGLAVAPDGTVYASDFQNERIRKIVPGR